MATLFSSLRNLRTVFCSDCITLHSYNYTIYWDMPTFPLGVNYAILSQKYVFLPPRATSLTSQSENLMNLDGWRCQVQEGWKWKSLSRVQLSVTPWTRQSSNSLGQNTGVGSQSLFQGIFPTQGSNPSLLYYRQILYHLSHQGSIY